MIDLIAKQGPRKSTLKRSAATDQAIQDQDKVSKSYIDDLANITQGFYKQHQASLEEAGRRPLKGHVKYRLSMQSMTALLPLQTFTLYDQGEGHHRLRLAAFSTRYQEQYDQAQAKREQLQRELRTSLNESERSLSDKNLTLQQQSINSRLAAQNQALAGEEKVQADVRTAEAENTQFAQKNGQEEKQKKNARKGRLIYVSRIPPWTEKLRYGSKRILMITAQNRIGSGMMQTGSGEYDLERKNFIKEQGEPVAISSGDQTYTLGSNNLPTLAEDVYNDLMQSYNEDIDKVNASGKKKRDKEKEIVNIDDVRRLISSKYKDLKTDKEKSIFCRTIRSEITKGPGEDQKAFPGLSR